MKKNLFLGVEQICGLELRPWTLTTRKAMLELIPEFKEDTSSVQRQIVTIAWIQSEDPDKVESYILDGSANERISKFERVFPLAAFPAVAEWAGRQAKAVEDAVVSVVNKPSDKKKSDSPPPNS